MRARLVFLLAGHLVAFNEADERRHKSTRAEREKKERGRGAEVKAKNKKKCSAPFMD